MIVKIIQNLEIKVESQINNLETRIEKMQERFNKDLEEIKKSQYIINNAINEIKNTLEVTNSIKWRQKISEVEDRMVEINESEGKKEKRMKRNEDNLKDFQNSVKCPNIRITGVPEEDKKKDHEKILEEITVENFPKMGKEIATQVQETQSRKQDKPKAKHPKTDINQINEDQTQRTNIKSSKGKTTNNSQGDSHRNQPTFQ